jgi:hypothetical protein
VPAGAVIRFGRPLSHIHMRKGCVDRILLIFLVLIDVTRTARGGMKSFDPSLTTKGEGMLRLMNDI